jgi:hypothetical protein
MVKCIDACIFIDVPEQNVVEKLLKELRNEKRNTYFRHASVDDSLPWLCPFELGRYCLQFLALCVLFAAN